MAVEASTPGYIFGGSTGISYEQLQKRRAVLEAMSARNSGNVPRNVGEGLAALGDALASRIESSRLNAAEAEMQKTQSGFASMLESGYGDMLDGGAGFGGATGAISDGSDPRFTMGNAGREIAANPSDAGIYDSFIGTVKEGGLSNPYGLAAVAATGQAESGYSSKNAFGEWSDPSESGGAGQAGGVMSWRADRLANMRRFAAENGDDPRRPSPATQAKFFMAEDPSLIAKLQSAQSVEEAQRHMNNAWRFAGYDRPGGEAARRMKAAAGFLPRFSDAGGAAAAIEQQAPIQVASADPNFMPSGPQAPVGGAVAPDGLKAVPMSIRDSLGKAAAASTLRGETSGAGGSTFGQPEVDAVTARAAAERASNPNIQPWTGPAEIDGREFGSTAPGQGSLAAVLPPGVDPAPGTGQVNAPPAGATGGANGALVAALQTRQANRANGAGASVPGVAPMAPPVSIGANPVPPQDPMAGLDPRTSPEARAYMASGEFDGMGFASAQAPVGGRGQALPMPDAPAAPTEGVGRVLGAVQQAAQTRGVDPRALLGIMNSPVATPGQRQVAAAMLEQMQDRQALAAKQAFDARQKAEERAYEERVRREGYTREDSRFAVTDAREAARLDLERQRAAREGSKPIEVGGVLLDPQTMKPVYTAPEKPTGTMQEYAAYAADERAAGREPIGRLAYEQALRKSSAQTTTINNGGGNTTKFVEKSDEAAAKRLDDIVQSGGTAAQTLGDVQQLADLGRQIGTGKVAQVKAALGPYAQALGIDIANQGEAEAYQSIIARMAPQMRPAGAGATSDFDARQFLASLPSLGNTPEGNKIITDTFTAVQQNKLQAAEIASQAYTPIEQGGITWQEAEKRIRALPNPYERFKATQTRGGDAAPRSDAPAGPEGATPIQRARNPKTGELLELRNGQWVAVQ